MSTRTQGVQVVCDQCGGVRSTNRTTSAGARGDAARDGWRVARLAGGIHIKRSNDKNARDLCRYCANPDRSEGLFEQSAEGDR